MNIKKLAVVLCASAAVIISAPVNTVNKLSHSVTASAADTKTVTFTSIGQTSQVTLSGTGETPTWYSDNTNVASVDQNGKITAVGEGTCKVYAVFSNQVLECTVIVEIPEEKKEIILGNISLSNENPGVELSVPDMDITGAVWHTSDNKIASVDQKGKVTAVGSGQCTVWFELKGKKYIVNVTSSYSPQTTTAPVTEVVLGELQLNNTNNAGTITLNGVPEGTVIVWSSDNEQVAKVDQKGKVTAVSSGNCNIIALIDGVKYITKISSSYDPASASTTKPSEVFLNNMELSNSYPSSIITLSGVADGTVITWNSSNEKVAVVDQNGKVTAIGPGTCRINAVIDGVSYYMNVTSTYEPVKDIAIIADTDEIEINSSLKLELVNTDKTAEWISTDINVLTVDKNGLVKAVGVGKANIIAKVDGKVLTMTITVKERSSCEVLYGDVDLDGDVTINDAVRIMTYVANSNAYPLTEEALNNGDVSSRGDSISNMDALAIQKFLAQITNELPES